MHSIDSGDADCINPQHENSISGHMGSHGNDRFHIAPDMTIPGHNQFSQGLTPHSLGDADDVPLLSPSLSLSH